MEEKGKNEALRKAKPIAQEHEILKSVVPCLWLSK